MEYKQTNKRRIGVIDFLLADVGKPCLQDIFSNKVFNHQKTRHRVFKGSLANQANRF